MPPTEERKPFPTDENGLSVRSARNSIQTTPRMNLIADPNEPVAFDIEHVHWKSIGEDGKTFGKTSFRIGRIGVVNARGELVYDVYANYPHDPYVHLMFPKGFCVNARDIELENGARPIDEVKKNLKEIFKGRLAVGLGLAGCDMKALIPLGVLRYVRGIWDAHNHYTSQWTLAFGAFSLEEMIEMRFKPPPPLEYHYPADDARGAMLLFTRLHPYPPPPKSELSAMQIDPDSEDDEDGGVPI